MSDFKSENFDTLEEGRAQALINDAWRRLVSYHGKDGLFFANNETYRVDLRLSDDELPEPPIPDVVEFFMEFLRTQEGFFTGTWRVIGRIVGTDIAHVVSEGQAWEKSK